MLVRRSSRWLQRRLATGRPIRGPRSPSFIRALEEVLKNEPKPEWDFFAIKYGYLEIMRVLERPMPSSAQQEIEGEWTFRLGDMQLSPT